MIEQSKKVDLEVEEKKRKKRGKVFYGFRKILVVDDDKNSVGINTDEAEKAGYDVTTALHEDEAIEKAKEQIFDLAIVDLN